MKNTTRSNVYVSMAALTLTAAVVIPAAAQQRFPSRVRSKGVTPPHRAPPPPR
jgi:hypothetical protein